MKPKERGDVIGKKQGIIKNKILGFMKMKKKERLPQPVPMPGSSFGKKLAAGPSLSRRQLS